MSGVPALFRACAEGNANAWEELLRLYGRRIRLTTLRIVRQYGVPEEYEDVVQALCTDLYARRRRVFEQFEAREPGSEERYLTVVVANWVRTYCRAAALRRAREVPHDPLIEPAAPGADTPRITVDDAVRILATDTSNKHLGRDTTIVRLYFGQGYTSAQIAGFRSIGLSESGVEGVILRAKRAIQQVLFSNQPERKNTPTLRFIQEEGRE